MTEATDHMRGPVGSSYEHLATLNREPFLRRARASSALTLPYLIPPEGHDSNNILPTPYQSVGARGVTNLSAKLLLTMFPAGTSFIRMDMDPYTRQEIADEEEQKLIDEALGNVERTFAMFVETSAIRPSADTALQHLLVSGNVLLFIDYDKKKKAENVRVFPLEKYVVRRDPSGNVLDIIVKEVISPKALPEAIRKLAGLLDEDEDKEKGRVKTVELYTKIQRADSQWEVHQEIRGKEIPDSRSTYPLAAPRWLPLRLHKIDGEDYGRGLVEEYLGDLQSLEGLYKAIVKGSQAAAKVLFLIDPNSVTKAKDLNKAPTATFVTGRKEDIDTLGLDKFADFRVALETIDRLEARLAQGFMLEQSIQRNAERVTAEEIRYLAAALDSALGGIYSVLAQEFQLPLANRIMLDMERANLLPALPKDGLNTVVTTGLDALGRTEELVRLDSFVDRLFNLSPELAETYIDISNYNTRRANALNIDPNGLVRSTEQVEAVKNQQRLEAAVQQLGPEAMRQIGQATQQPQEG